MERQVIDYLPEWLQEFQEIKILCDVQQTQVEALWDAVESIYNNNFMEDLEAAGCVRWERMLGIQNKDTYTLEERRTKIATRMLEQRPFTIHSLKATLDSLCGEDGYDVELDGYKLTIKISLSSKNTLDNVQQFVDRIKPANMLCETDLLYNVYEFLEAYTYAELTEHTYESLRNEVL